MNCSSYNYKSSHPRYHPANPTPAGVILPDAAATCLWALERFDTRTQNRQGCGPALPAGLQSAVIRLHGPKRVGSISQHLPLTRACETTFFRVEHLRQYFSVKSRYTVRLECKVCMKLRRGRSSSLRDQPSTAGYFHSGDSCLPTRSESALKNALSGHMDFKSKKIRALQVRGTFIALRCLKGLLRETVGSWVALPHSWTLV